MADAGREEEDLTAATEGTLSASMDAEEALTGGAPEETVAEVQLSCLHEQVDLSRLFETFDPLRRPPRPSSRGVKSPSSPISPLNRLVLTAKLEEKLGMDPSPLDVLDRLDARPRSVRAQLRPPPQLQHIRRRGINARVLDNLNASR